MPPDLFRQTIVDQNIFQMIPPPSSIQPYWGRNKRHGHHPQTEPPSKFARETALLSLRPDEYCDIFRTEIRILRQKSWFPI